MSLPKIPLLRQGQVYHSLDTVTLRDYRSGEALALVSQANLGLIQKDFEQHRKARAILAKSSTDELLDICERTADIFCQGTLPLGDQQQSPEDYIACLSATSGLPHTLCRANMAKIHKALSGIRGIFKSLTRGLASHLLDAGVGEHEGLLMSFIPTADALVAILPSNSPGVNSIWAPSIALKTPVVMKPGREEPWTPFRLIQAFISAGCPKEAFSFYPTSHQSADFMMRHCQRGIIFGDDRTTSRYASHPGIERHGTGRSKVLIGEDCIENWPDYIDLIVTSMSANGGRSCVNASTILVPKYARQIGEELAQRLAKIEPLPADHPDALLSAFANPRFAELIDAAVDSGLKTPGATDLTALCRQGPRRVTLEGGQYLRPTLVACDSIDHPLGNTEYLFPFASIVEMPQQDMLDNIGPSLVVSLITENENWRLQALAKPEVDRLNLGAMSTTTVEWDQPHEGNLFDLLYRRRAIQKVTL